MAFLNAASTSKKKIPVTSFQMAAEISDKYIHKTSALKTEIISLAG